MPTGANKLGLEFREDNSGLKVIKYFDGAEPCELVGCMIFSELSNLYGNTISLYRDDGWAIINETPRKIEIIKKTSKIFNNYGLKVTIKANKKSSGLLGCGIKPEQRQIQDLQ